MGATTSIDLKKQRFAGVRGHNQRVGNPSNKNIKPELTQYNERVVVEDYDAIIEDYLGDYVKEVDKNRSNNPNAKNAKYGSAKAMASRDFFNPEITSVGTFGSKETKREILDIFMEQGVSEKEVYEAFNQACYNFLVGEFGNEFNARNQNTLKLSEYHTHVDEEAFHYHAYIVGCGWTKKGKPSKGWNHALREQFEEDYEGMDSESAEANRGRMSKWRYREDSEFHRCCIQSFKWLAYEKDVFFPSNRFEFIRLNPKDGEKGLDMKTYQRLQDIKGRESEFTDILRSYGPLDGDTLKETLADFKKRAETTIQEADDASAEYFSLYWKKKHLEEDISELEERKTLEEAKNTNQAEIDAENQRHLLALQQLKENNKKVVDRYKRQVEVAKKSTTVKTDAKNELKNDQKFRDELKQDVDFSKKIIKSLPETERIRIAKEYAMKNEEEMLQIATDHYRHLIETSNDPEYVEIRANTEMIASELGETRAFNTKIKELDDLINSSLNPQVRENAGVDKRKVQNKQAKERKARQKQLDDGPDI